MPGFKPMLAKAPDVDEDGNVKISYPQIAQPKLDGIRAAVVDGKLVSRTLKPIPNAEIRAALERPEFEGLDGELIVGDPLADDCYRTTCSFVMAPNKTGEPWTFRVFDLWTSAASYMERAEHLRLKLLNLSGCVNVQFVDRLRLVEGVPVNSQPELDAIEAEWLEHGMEGVILRDPDGLYKFGRSGKTGPLLKVKRFIDFEAVVVGVYEEMHNENERYENELGRGQRSTAKAGLVGKDALGGLVLRALNGPAEGVEFRCGTGFDAEQRDRLWREFKLDDGPEPREGYLGNVAKIKSFPIGVKDKPRHPVFLGWRDMEIDG